MKLLVSAFSCGPGLGSEPGIGWHTVEELAREHEVWVMVDANCESTILRALQGRKPERIHLHYLRIPLFTHLVNGPLNNGLAWLVYYYVWQFFEFVAARRLHANIGFDACQHVTFGKFNVPSFLHLLGIPFIWGPLGGAEKAPMVFFREFGWKTMLEERARIVLQNLAWVDPWVRWCHRRSTRALAATEESALAMRSLGATQVQVMPAVALSEEEIAAIHMGSKSADESRLTLLYVGRLIPWKGVHLGLRAMAACGHKNLHYRIVGDGPQRSALEAEARSLGVADRVTFTGNLQRSELLHSYAEADGFLYPSLHDSGGNAVLEAMAAGLPILCLRYGGPQWLVAEGCGWKVTATSPDEAIAGLAAALDEFTASADERRSRGESAHAHCLRQHSWKERGEALRTVYRDCCLPS